MSLNKKYQLERVPGAPLSDQEILDDMRLAAKLANSSVLSKRLYSEFGKYAPRNIAQRFGSWNNAVTKAGLQIANEINISDERLFENLMHLWEHYGRQPRAAELARPPSTISAFPYKRRFRTWMDALAQFIAYANEQKLQPPKADATANGRRTSRNPSLRMRFRILQRDNFTCRCGASPALTPGLSLHVDHIKAWSLGGETVDENLRTLCERCNLGKSNVL